MDIYLLTTVRLGPDPTKVGVYCIIKHSNILLIIYVFIVSNECPPSLKKQNNRLAGFILPNIGISQ